MGPCAWIYRNSGRHREFSGDARTEIRVGLDGSVLKSLSLVKAGNAGVTITASNVTVQGNDIGLLSNGTTVAGNRGDGVQINASSHGDLIGKSTPFRASTTIDD